MGKCKKKKTTETVNKTEESTKTNSTKSKKSNWQQNTEELLKQKDQEIQKLKSKLEDQQLITAKAQQDYVNLKMDFDHLQERFRKLQDEWKIDILIDLIKKFLPFIESLRKSLENIKDKQNPLAKWVEMVYNNFLKTLEQMHIYKIESIGKHPDSLLHEPISTQPVDDKKLKWKIVMEFEQWFIYKKDWVEKVVKPSKVIIWQ